MLSLIIPVYDGGKWLAELIDSLNCQTCGDFEVVFINDGSTDDSLEILKAQCHKDSRFRLFDQKHQGVSAARNAGINHITGDFFTFVDCDDMLNIHAVEDWSQTIINNNLDCLVEQRLTHFEKRQLLQTEHSVDGDLSIYERLEAKRYFLTGAWSGFVGGKIYRSSSCRYLRFQAEISLWEDLQFFLQALDNGSRWGFSTESHYYYRQRRTSLSHQPLTEMMMLNVLDVSCQALETMAHDGMTVQEMQKAWSDNFLRFYQNILPQIYAKSEDSQRQYINKRFQQASLLIHTAPLDALSFFFIRHLNGHGYHAWLRIGRVASRLCVGMKERFCTKRTFQIREKLGYS